MDPVNQSESPKSTLVDIQQIPEPYRDIFAEYPTFNVVQSIVFHDVLYTDNSIALSAPTGSGKTVIFELAIVRQLIAIENLSYSNMLKVVYISPMKALCEERLIDWHKKFSPYGVSCISVTGDSDFIDIQSLSNHNLIITTPEKWDSITRKWKDNKKFIQLIKLLMIDEIHLLNEETRGATLEALICRMKTIRNSIPDDEDEDEMCLNQNIRFLAVSATFPNIKNLGEWLGGAKYFSFDTSIRPVKLNTIVLGYNYNTTSTPFKFDIMLNYKLPGLIIKYSNGKPTLVFCSTRKSVEMAAKQLTQTLTIPLNNDQRQVLIKASSIITDSKLKSTVIHGIGYHHGGVLAESRNVIEQLFRAGGLPVLLTTSTLATGVNLPAHLVIIKSTKYYDKGGFQDYTPTAVLQMIGRAGRPQFDTEATALILTPTSDKEKFTKMIDGNQDIESNLHRHLTEHLNAEIVLRTITDLDVAMRWLSSTFLYIRARENPRHYGIAVGLSTEKIDKKLLEVCQIDLNKLVKAGMASMDEDTNINPTKLGVLMAKFYMSFESMKLFKTMTGFEIMQQVLGLISKCQEFSDMRLRVDEKKCLNLLNKSKNKDSIRFPFNSKIKTLDMKINCTIQAVFGCLEIEDHSILTEAFRIMRLGEKISRCLIEYLETRGNCYAALLNSTIIWKCFRVQLWENSPHIAKQFPGIGLVTSTQLVNAGKTSLEILMKMNPRDIEMITKKKPPFGNKLIEMAKSIPRYQMTLEKIIEDGTSILKITITFLNPECLEETTIINADSIMCLLVGDNCNNILLYERYMHSYILDNSQVVRFLEINNHQGRVTEIYAHFLSENIVGIDLNETYRIENFEQKTAKLKKNEDQENSKANKKSLKMLNGDYAKLVQTHMDNYLKCKKTYPERANREFQNTKLNSIVTREKRQSTGKSQYEDNNENKTIFQQTALIPKNDDHYNLSMFEKSFQVPEHKINNENNTKFQQTAVIPKIEDHYNLTMFEKSFQVPEHKINNAEKEIPPALSSSVETLSDEELSEHIETILDREQKGNESEKKKNFETGNEKNYSENSEFLNSSVASQLPKLYSKYGMEENSYEKKQHEDTLKKPGIIKNVQKPGIVSRPTKNSQRFPFEKQKLHSAESFETSVFSSNSDSLKKYRFHPSKRFAHETEEIQLPEAEDKRRKLENTNMPTFEDSNDFLESNAKSISWRSPLVYSPPTKYSPRIPASFSFSIPMPKINDSISSHDLSNNTLDTSTSSRNQKVSSTVEPHQCEEDKPIKKTPTKGTRVCLSDREYGPVVQENLKDTMIHRNNSHNHPQDFHVANKSLQIQDIMSESFLEDFGLAQKQKMNSSIQDFTQRRSKISDSQISTSNYYHNLLAEKPHTQNKAKISSQIPNSQASFFLNQEIIDAGDDANTNVVLNNHERSLRADMNQSFHQMNMQKNYLTNPQYFNIPFPPMEVRQNSWMTPVYHMNSSPTPQQIPIYSPNFNNVGQIYPPGFMQNPTNSIYYNNNQTIGPRFLSPISNQNVKEPRTQNVPLQIEGRRNYDDERMQYCMPTSNTVQQQMMNSSFYTKKQEGKRIAPSDNHIYDPRQLENLDPNVTVRERNSKQMHKSALEDANVSQKNNCSSPSPGFFLNQPKLPLQMQDNFPSAPGLNICSTHRVLNCYICLSNFALNMPFNYSTNSSHKLLNPYPDQHSQTPPYSYNTFSQYQNTPNFSLPTNFGSFSNDVSVHGEMPNFGIQAQRRQMQGHFIQEDMLNSNNISKDQRCSNAKKIIEKKDNLGYQDAPEHKQYYLMNKFLNSYEISDERRNQNKE